MTTLRQPPAPTASATDALGLLYEQHAARLFRIACRICGSAADAEDTIHDLFVALPDLLPRYEERGRMDAWLTTLTTRLALGKVRKSGRRRETVLDDDIHPAVDGLTPEMIALTDAIAALPISLRVVFVLHVQEGYSHAEIADMLEITAGASRVRLTRALVLLRTKLRDQ